MKNQGNRNFVLYTGPEGMKAFNEAFKDHLKGITQEKMDELMRDLNPEAMAALQKRGKYPRRKLK